MVRFTVLMTLDCVVVEFRCDSDLWSVRSMARFVRQLACMRMSWCVMFATRFSHFSRHARAQRCGLDVQLRRPHERPLSLSSVPPWSPVRC
jgi:hypothetical protein